MSIIYAISDPFYGPQGVSGAEFYTSPGESADDVLNDFARRGYRVEPTGKTVERDSSHSDRGGEPYTVYKAHFVGYGGEAKYNYLGIAERVSYPASYPVPDARPGEYEVDLDE